ncbi:hypothetical protein BO82DRAFT_431732 [Aspergillus uvarum CBS 121591]|uniref:Uncharacterized protein n=1 Tax=Aspergillus uvarum CBS 121591 TaxID=1448315 RepID=A0A319CE61_9EURO|nr:hypothetical protein BO82DRAFT_431732 [Aspergillus uvarum CBS 121591]PYH82519.1 hypothetical protein BO82DRAFT_431732 [Aspergillus uvarum CBS 121591]
MMPITPLYQRPQNHHSPTTIPPPAYITIDSPGSEEAYDLEAFPHQNKTQPDYNPPQSTVTVSKAKRLRQLVTAATSKISFNPTSTALERTRLRCAILALIIVGLVMVIMLGGICALIVLGNVSEGKNGNLHVFLPSLSLRQG